MNKKITAMDIANYIVEFTNNTLDKSNLTPIKLQKIMYYVYVNCLVKHDVKLFDQPIEKWKFGPVVSSVYHNFKVYGVDHIDSPISSYEFNDNADGGFSFKEVPFDHSSIVLKPEVFAEIHSTIQDLIEVDPFDLVERTHKEAPWKKYEPNILKGDRGLIYSDEEIKAYFKAK